MRLIDADEFKKQLENADEYTELAEVIEMLDNAPTVIWCSETPEGLPLMDMRERPQGEWVMITEPDGFIHSKCSVCNQFNDWGDVPFCPWCGADMRGEKK